MDTKLKNTIMRRVYYTYAIRVAMNPTLLHGLLMFTVLLLLTKYVSIGNVISNLMNVELGRLATYLLDAAINTEMLTLLLVGMFIFAAFSLRFQLRGREHSLHALHV